MDDMITILTKRYRQGAIGTSDISNPEKANRYQSQMHDCYKILRETDAGHDAIIALMDDVEPSVRCWAAAHSLKWKPECACKVLRALRDSGGPYSFTAEMTLKEFEKGKLNFDY